MQNEVMFYYSRKKTNKNKIVSVISIIVSAILILYLLFFDISITPILIEKNIELNFTKSAQHQMNTISTN